MSESWRLLRKLGAILILSPALARAAPSLLGIELGAPLTMPDCPSAELYADRIASHDACISRSSHDHMNNGDDFLKVRLPVTGRPDYLREASVTISNGVVGSIYLGTWGNDRQDEALAALTAKLGKPSKASKRNLQNRFGAQYTEKDAQWSGPGWKVKFEGIDDEIDHGTISASTDEFDKREAEREAARAGARLKL